MSPPMQAVVKRSPCDDVCASGLQKHTNFNSINRGKKTTTFINQNRPKRGEKLTEKTLFKRGRKRRKEGRLQLRGIRSVRSSGSLSGVYHCVYHSETTRRPFGNHSEVVGLLDASIGRLVTLVRLDHPAYRSDTVALVCSSWAALAIFDTLLETASPDAFS